MIQKNDRGILNLLKKETAHDRSDSMKFTDIQNINPKITGWKNYYSTKTNEKWMQALDWYIICTFTRWYNQKHQRRKHMSRVGFVRNSIYEKGLKKMARA